MRVNKNRKYLQKIFEFVRNGRNKDHPSNYCLFFVEDVKRLQNLFIFVQGVYKQECFTWHWFIIRIKSFA